MWIKESNLMKWDVASMERPSGLAAGFGEIKNGQPNDHGCWYGKESEIGKSAVWHEDGQSGCKKRFRLLLVTWPLSTRHHL